MPVDDQLTYLGMSAKQIIIRKKLVKKAKMEEEEEAAQQETKGKCYMQICEKRA
jgi:hypothetical protein